MQDINNISFNTAQHSAVFNAGVVHFTETVDGRGMLVEVASLAKEEMKDNKGGQLVITLRGLEAPDLGKEVPLRFGLWAHDVGHASKGSQHFAGVLACMGVSGQIAMGQIIKKQFRVIVTNEGNPDYPNSTRISGYRDVNGNEPNKAPVHPVGGGAAQQGGGFGQTGQFAGNGQAQGQAQGQGGFGGQQQQGGGAGWGNAQQQQQQQTQQGGGFDPNQQQQQQQGFNPQQGQGGFNPNAGQGFDPNAQQQQQGGGFNPNAQQGGGDKPAWA